MKENDFKELKKSCPKAMEVFENTNKGGARDYPETDGTCYYSKDVNGGHRYYNERDLYDFFDEHGIYLNIIPRCHHKEVCFEVVGLRHYPNTSHLGQKEYLFDEWEYLKYKTRHEAENIGFVKAFEYLEYTLSPQNKQGNNN